MPNRMTGREGLFYLGGALKSEADWERKKREKALAAGDDREALLAAGKLAAYEKIIGDIEDLKECCTKEVGLWQSNQL